MDPIILARIQFAANISFHILFPTITIALGWALLFFKLRYNRTRDEAWMDAYRFWVKVFALSFAMGVVSGITMSFQFGTNWPGFMERVGNIAGPLLAYEVLTAFFLEATFLGIMLFGFRRVPNWVHTLATVLVAFGTTMSAFWILVLNSWMHTPAVTNCATASSCDGLVGDRLQPVHALPARAHADRVRPHLRLPHGGAVGLALAAARPRPGCRGRAEDRRLPGRRADPDPDFRRRPAWVEHAAASAGQSRSDGRQLGDARQRASPAVRRPERAGAPQRFRDRRPQRREPDPQARSRRRRPWPQRLRRRRRNAPASAVAPVFYAFRIMVGVGMLMLAVSWFAGWRLWRRGTIDRPLAWVLVAMTFSGWIATLAGWYVTENRTPALAGDGRPHDGPGRLGGARRHDRHDACALTSRPMPRCFQPTSRWSSISPARAARSG